MFQVIAMWNLSRPDEEMRDSVQDIELRGYDPKTFLTGQFAFRLRIGEIKPLPVSSIADKYCPTRRDLYLTKGINRPSNIVDRKTWGRIVGNVVENYINGILGQSGKQNTPYASLIENGRKLNEEFLKSSSKVISRLRGAEKRSEGAGAGDTDWLLKLLDYNGRAELGLRLLHSMIREEESLNIAHIETDQRDRKIRPSKLQIGINAPATPDFVAPDFGIVGDIKSGTHFKDHFLLTCAGYALAYENQHGEEHDINWGVIYFFPTRSPSEYVRPLTFAQVYIFPIDDRLRRWFIDKRDEAYDIISKSDLPDVPPIDRTEHCQYCRFRNHCVSDGLELQDYER